jgi:hypothetical protein
MARAPVQLVPAGIRTPVLRRSIEQNDVLVSIDRDDCILVELMIEFRRFWLSSKSATTWSVRRSCLPRKNAAIQRDERRSSARVAMTIAA